MSHLIGHGVTHGPAPGSGHGYVVPALAAIAPLAALAVAAAAVREARRAALGPHLGVARLLAAQVVLFLLQEVVEDLVLGHVHSLTSEPAVLLGLVAQVPVAVVLCRLVRLVRRVASTWFGASSPRRPAPLSRWPSTPEVLASSTVWSPLASRAPPALV